MRGKENGSPFASSIFSLSILVIVLLTMMCANAQVVTLKGGQKINGLEGENYFEYLGIPYAQPPLAHLRWQSPLSFVLPAEYNATAFKPACPQVDGFDLPPYAYSEDCLYLNIWTPYGAKEGDKIPVMVFIHGGGWSAGSGSLPLYWGDYFANSTNSIVVTFNYRLGALGFLTCESLSGNYGFEDQRAVMAWVNANIHSFGGDSSQVTLFGQSAGGMSVAGHLTSPLSFGYFSKAISHSGPPVITFRTQEESKYYSKQFAEKLGCGECDVECMTSANISQIIAAQSKVLPNLSLPWTLQNFLIWMPVIDDVNILGSSQDLLNLGKVAPGVDMIWGSTRDETAGWVMGFMEGVPITVGIYKRILENIFGANSEEVFDKYPASTPNQVRQSLSALSTDWVFTCSQKHSAKAMASLPNGGIVRNFVFLHPPSSDPRDTGTVSHCSSLQQVCHGAELDYVFHSYSNAGATFTSDELALSRDCVGIWSSYANGTLDESFWPAYEVSEDNSLGIDVNAIQMQNNYRSSYCDFWESIGAYGTIQS